MGAADAGTPLAGSGAAQARRRNPLAAYFARFDDGELTRWAFLGMLIGTIGVLAIDLRDLAAENGWTSPQAPSEVMLPVLPPAVETDGPARPGGARPEVTLDNETLRQPMRFTLEPGGVLAAVGSIDPGAAARLEEELGARSEYVRTVSFNSPGGAIEDAMAIGRELRSRGLGTAVADGALCASSCPLAFAGGRQRSAGREAAIGVHQFYAAEQQTLAAAQAMSDAQATTARITRYLAEMDVDPALWLHALDTPPNTLYFFSPDELARFKLVNSQGALAGR